MAFGKTRLVAKFAMGSSVVALMCAAGFTAASAQTAPADQIETVTVTGFKASIERALDAKRNALDSSDSILAEDIAKFPDLNLSESIQRIPGIALQRDEGEGKEIQVRGLSAQFTRVRLDGIEALTVVGAEDSQGGTNRTRAFDFNTFSSDLFSGITVHKSASADLEEGSLGATVDLSTPHPFDHDGFTFSVNGQAGLAEQGGEFNPRMSAVISDTFMGGKLGFLLGLDLDSRKTTELGFDTTRFENDNTQQNAAHTAPLVGGCVANNPPTAGTQCTLTQRFGSVVYTGTDLPGASNTANVLTQGHFAAGNAALQQAPFIETSGSVPNCTTATPCPTTFNTTAPNNYDVVNEAFGARFPRYDLIPNTDRRVGLIGSMQYQPDNDTLVTVDLMASDFAVVRQEYYLEANSLSLNQNASNLGSFTQVTTSGNVSLALAANTLGREAVNILSYTLNPATNNLDAITASNVGLRIEHRMDHLDTRFGEGVVHAHHDFGDDFKVNLMVGWDESHHNNPIQTTLTMDYDCTAATATGGLAANCPGGVTGGAGSLADPFALDFTKSNRTPVLSFGNVDPTSTNGWFLSQIRERAAAVDNSFRTISGDAEWDPTDWLKVTGGFDIRNYGNGQFMSARSNGSSASLDSYIPHVIQTTALSSYTELVHFSGLDVPPGTTTTWLVPSITKAASLFGIFDQTANPEVLTTSVGACAVQPGCSPFLQGTSSFGSSNGTVREQDDGVWMELGWNGTFYGVPFRGNVGGRYVQTGTDSLGIAFNATSKTFVATEVQSLYHDFLPSLNVVVNPSDTFLIRFNASQVINRPNLTSMLPGVTIAAPAGANPASVTSGNPKLPPLRAKTLDLSFEWYYEKAALLSFAFFYKHLDNVESTQQLSGPFLTNPLGLPDSLLLAACGGTFTTLCNDTNSNTVYTTTRSQKGSPLYGTEIDWNQPFDFLPGPLAYTGFLGNFTYVQARQNYILNPALPTQTTPADLTGLSRITYNATLYYDDTVFEARVSAAFRSHFLLAIGPTSGLSNNDSQVQQASLNVDASTSYKINDNFSVDLQAINLTNQGLYQYNDTVGHRPLAYYTTGREFFLGLRYNY